MTKKMRILVTAPYFVPVVGRYRQRLEAANCELVVLQVAERASEEELLEVIEDIDGVIAGDDAFTERVLASGRRLKVLAKWGTGIDSFDQEACHRRGIAIRNTPDAFSVPVADTVLGYALAFTRNISNMDRAMKKGQWQKIQGVALQDCTFGIIGVGNCGQQVARRVACFGARLLGNDIKEIPEDVVRETGLSPVELETLLAESDLVSLNCDLNPTSHHLINAVTLSLMKPSAFLINTSRGPVVDEPALVAALQAGKLGGAGLDVFEVEPLPGNSPLLQMDNVYLAPHNANSSSTAWVKVHERTVANVIEALESHGK